MIRVDVPGWKTIELEHLLLDLNGTIAQDGEPLPGVAGRLAALSPHLAIHLVTADTHGRAADVSARLAVRLSRVEPGREADQKQALVERLGAGGVVAIGNGANDARMLSTAAVGIAILGPEGLAGDALHAADLVVARIEDALDVLRYPRRLVATLRR